jgi:hypothetical protein
LIVFKRYGIGALLDNLKKPGTVLSLAILLGFADSKRNGWHVGWVEERNPTKDIGMLNPTYE